jgi:hypothetical protein
MMLTVLNGRRPSTSKAREDRTTSMTGLITVLLDDAINAMKRRDSLCAMTLFTRE